MKIFFGEKNAYFHANLAHLFNVLFCEKTAKAKHSQDLFLLEILTQLQCLFSNKNTFLTRDS